MESKIKYKAEDKPSVGLGFSIVPTGDQSYEYSKRLEQARDSVRKVATATLSVTEAWILLTTRILPKVTYPFMLTRFTVKQLYRLSVTIDNIILPKMKINRKMARAPIYAPEELGGLNYPHIGTIQDQKGISHFVKHLKWGKEIGTDLRILLSHAQINSGWVTPLMEDTALAITYMEEGMISHLRDRLHALEGSIWIENVWKPSLQRIGDQSIMEAFAKCENKQITKHKLRLANEFRLRTRVITIADLADVDGRQISPDELSGTWRAPTQLKWPNLPPPTSKMIDAFRLCLRKTFCSKPKRVLTRMPMKLDTPLGKWIQAPRHIEYDYYRTEEWVYERVYNREGIGAYQRYNQMSINKSKFYKEEVVDDLPDTTIPIEAYVKHSFAFPTHQYALEQAPLQMSPEEDDMQNGELMHTNIKKIGVSDGSVDPITGMAAYAWILTTRERKGHIKRKRPVLANPKYLNSYRAELSGLVDMLQYIARNGMETHEIELWCDSESVVDRLTHKSEMSLTDMTSPESDLLLVARRYLKELPNVTLQHVYEHQDDDTPVSKLPFEAQLNIECDVDAKEFMKGMTYSAIKPLPTEGAGAILYLGTNMVTTKMEEQIKYAAHAKQQFTYLRKKYEWTDSQLSTVNWDAVGAAKRRLKKDASTRITKMMHEWLNLGSQKKKMGQDDMCPCCGCEVEDQLHLYQCQHVEMIEAKENALDQNATRLIKDHLPPAIVTTFNNLTHSAVKSERIRKPIACNTAWEAGEAQLTLGSMALLRGHHHVDWVPAIKETFRRPEDPPGTKEPKRYKTPFEMSVSMVKASWNLFESIWQARNEILHSLGGYAAKGESSPSIPP